MVNEEDPKSMILELRISSFIYLSLFYVYVCSSNALALPLLSTNLLLQHSVTFPWKDYVS